MIAASSAGRSANRFLVLMATFLPGGGWPVVGGNTPVDALPDLSDTQVIVRTTYPGKRRRWSRTWSPIR
jgi:Cu(I)/Ag(I) efflux system membrane protein CusA/SilA